MLESLTLGGRVPALRNEFPTLRHEGRNLGMSAFVVFSARCAYDVVRGRMSAGIASHTGLWPPFEQPVVTRFGYAASGRYSRWTFPVAGPNSQVAHSAEAVVFAASTPQAKYSLFCGRGSGGTTAGILLGKNAAGNFTAAVYDTAWREAVSTTVIESGRLYVIHGVVRSNVLYLYCNGVQEASVAVPTTSGFYLGEFRVPPGEDYDANMRILSAATVNNLAWSEGVIRQRARDPWGILEWTSDRVSAFRLPAGGTTFNDTISDATALADSIGAAISFSAALSDSWALAESTAATATISAAFSGSVFVDDIGNPAVAAVTFATTLTDSAAFGESFAGGLLMDAVFSDALTAADSLACAITFSAAIFGSAFVDDIGNPAVAAVTFVTALSDSATLAESLVGGLVYTSAFSDGWTVGEGFGDSLTLFAQAAFTMLQVTVVVGRIELVSGGPAATFINLTEQQSRV